MREIKFRVKSRWNNTWKICQFADLGLFHPKWDTMMTLGQFTGLRDKNGKEIYEGDFILWIDGASATFNVEWMAKEAKFNLDRDVADHSEVIGNIHENPELLK